MGMKKFILFLSLLSSTLVNASNFYEFLSKREKIYKIKHDGIASVPILSIIGEHKRRRQISKALSEIKNLVNNGDFTPYEKSLLESIISIDEKTKFSRKKCV